MTVGHVTQLDENNNDNKLLYKFLIFKVIFISSCITDLQSRHFTESNKSI